MDSQLVNPRTSVPRSVSPTQQSFENASPSAKSTFCMENLRAEINQLQSEVQSTCSPVSPPKTSSNNNNNINATSLIAQSRSMCRYCHGMHPTELIDEHQDNCEQRTIKCEACEENVELEIFDFHLEMCPAMRDQGHGFYAEENFGYFLEPQHQNVQEQAPIQENLDGVENLQDSEGEEQEEEEEEEEEEPTSMTFEEMIGFDPSVMTYEQLIALDNTIVKKGMTEEEMKQFPTQVFLKELDGAHSCTVCISEFETGDLTRKLNCGHQFHKDCVDTWLESNITCPVCKKYLR